MFYWLFCNFTWQKLIALIWLVTFIYILMLASRARLVTKREIVTTKRTLLSNDQIYTSDMAGELLHPMSNDRQFKEVQSTIRTYKQTVHHKDSNNHKLSITERLKAQPNSSTQIKTKYRPNVPDTFNLTTNINLSSPKISLLKVYQNKWVGFPDFDGHFCSNALHSSTDNKLFPKRVRRINNAVFISDSKDCEYFKNKYGFNRYPEVTGDEQIFPIAFIILFHSNLDQVIFLLRAIYRAHNVYCLTVDVNAGEQFVHTVKAVVQCLPNVFVASTLERIVYAGFSRLMADINCMKDLLRRPEPWKYVINMPGQQFPLRTNLELVQILTLLNGSSDVEVTNEKMTCVKNRHIFKHIYAVNNKTGKIVPVKTEERNLPPPHGLKIMKGSAYGTFSRAFIQFVLHHPIAKDFLEWNKDVMSPDEYFWSTLHHSRLLQVPGRIQETNKPLPYITSFSVWRGNNQTCATIFVRQICIFSPEDLWNIATKSSLFANKFYITHHPATLHCLDQWLVNRTFAGSVVDLAMYKEGSESIDETYTDNLMKLN